MEEKGEIFMEQEEKWKTPAVSMGSDIKVQTFGGAEKITQTVEDLEKVQTIINDWKCYVKKIGKSYN